MAEGVGFEPTRAEARRFSRPVQYRIMRPLQKLN